MIDVTHISKNYGTTRAVQDISFQVAKGEVLGFLGPNGAGKSTTIRMLTCFIPASAGSARIAGYDVVADSIEVRRRIGYLPENNPLYMDMGVLDYLHFVAGMRAIAPRQRSSAVRRVVERCGLGPMTAKDIGELSKGFRQRLGLAQALIHDPDILILDEPTIGLDPHQIIGMRNLIREIGREKTVRAQLAYPARGCGNLRPCAYHEQGPYCGQRNARRAFSHGKRGPGNFGEHPR